MLQRSFQRSILLFKFFSSPLSSPFSPIRLLASPLPFPFFSSPLGVTFPLPLFPFYFFSSSLCGPFLFPSPLPFFFSSLPFPSSLLLLVICASPYSSPRWSMMQHCYQIDTPSSVQRIHILKKVILSGGSSDCGMQPVLGIFFCYFIYYFDSIFLDELILFFEWIWSVVLVLFWFILVLYSSFASFSCCFPPKSVKCGYQTLVLNHKITQFYKLVDPLWVESHIESFFW